MPRTFRDPLREGGLGPEMVVVPAGRFRMGCDRADRCTEGRREPDCCTRERHPSREVRIARPFAMSKHEATFDDYDRFLRAKGGGRHDEADDHGWGRGRRPVINVTWHDAVAYAEWLSEQTGERYRLPGEAEWEYAARAGSAGPWHWGDEILPNRANCKDCGSRWDDQSTAPVGSFPANAWGLHDMLGNVNEMLFDCFHIGYKRASTDGSPRTKPGRGRRFRAVDKNGDCVERSLRGGGWMAQVRGVTLSGRGVMDTTQYASTLGFRVAREIRENDSSER